MQDKPAIKVRADPVGRALLGLSKLVAIFGGMILVAITLLTVYSVIGRELVSLGWVPELFPFSLIRPVTGDFELVELGCGVAIFAFLPYCQIVRGNVIVDFFTARSGRRTKSALSFVGDAAYSAIAIVLTWRLWLGAIDFRNYGETSMVLRVPIWWAYVPAFAILVLLSLVCLYTAWRSACETLAGEDLIR